MNNKQIDEKQGKIMIADDNPTNVKLLEMMLSINGFKDIISTTDSRKIRDIFFEQKPDLLLLDLKMPHMDGFDILKQLNEDLGTEKLPVIIVSAQNDMENRNRALEMGVQDFILKPFNSKDIMLSLSNALKTMSDN